MLQKIYKINKKLFSQIEVDILHLKLNIYVVHCKLYKIILLFLQIQNIKANIIIEHAFYLFTILLSPS